MRSLDLYGPRIVNVGCNLWSFDIGFGQSRIGKIGLEVVTIPFQS